MKTLNLYKERDYSVVILSDKKEYKIPNDYTVEEVERILEKQAQIAKLANTEIDDETDEGIQSLRRFWDLTFAQLEILFQHYQPDITADTLRSLIKQQDALEITKFYQMNKYGVEGAKTEPENTKKKILNKSLQT
jgi:hypothetical protein